MAKKKAKDSAGLVVEMLQSGSRKLVQVMARLFNIILKGSGEPPDSWKKTLLTLFHKKGDVKMPDNYRPIALLPIMYKVFTKLLASRMDVVLDSAQPPDQAGLRSGYSVDDNLFTTAVLVESVCV